MERRDYPIRIQKLAEQGNEPVDVKIYRKPTIAMTIVKTILKQMPTVRQPQAKFLAILFATILALRGHVTLRNLSRYCDYSERTLARQFRAAFDWAAFHRLTCAQVVTAADVWIAAQDASLSARAASGPSAWAPFSKVRGARRTRAGNLDLRAD